MKNSAAKRDFKDFKDIDKSSEQLVDIKKKNQT